MPAVRPRHQHVPRHRDALVLVRLPSLPLLPSIPHFTDTVTPSNFVVALTVPALRLDAWTPQGTFRLVRSVERVRIRDGAAIRARDEGAVA